MARVTAELRGDCKSSLRKGELPAPHLRREKGGRGRQSSLLSQQKGKLPSGRVEKPGCFSPSPQRGAALLLSGGSAAPGTAPQAVPQLSAVSMAPAAARGIQYSHLAMKHWSDSGLVVFAAQGRQVTANVPQSSSGQCCTSSAFSAHWDKQREFGQQYQLWATGFGNFVLVLGSLLLDLCTIKSQYTRGLKKW